MTKSQWIIGVIVAMVAALAILCGKLGVRGKSPETPNETIEAKGPARSAFSDGKSGGAKTGKPAQRKSAAKRISRAPSDPFVTYLERARRETNAAEIYKTVFELMKDETTKELIDRITDLLGFSPSGDPMAPLSEKAKAELKALLTRPEMETIFDLLKEASRKDVRDFDLDASHDISKHVERLNAARTLVRMISGVALSFVREGDAASTFEFIDLGFKTTEGVCGDDRCVSRMVFLAGDAMMLTAFNAAVADAVLPEWQAEEIARKLGARDYAADTVAAIRKEATFSDSVIDKLVSGEISLETDDARLSVTDRENLVKVFGDKALVEENKRKNQEYREKLISLLSGNLNVSTQARAEALARELDALPSEKYALTRWANGGFCEWIKRIMAANARRDAALTGAATAIYKKRHGRAPASPADLNEIIDSLKR